VLVLNGNGADVAKHCVPAVPTKRFHLFVIFFFKKNHSSASNSNFDVMLTKTQDIHYLQKNGPSIASIQF
jgi:hypothetical protein